MFPRLVRVICWVVGLMMGIMKVLVLGVYIVPNSLNEFLTKMYLFTKISYTI